MVEISLILNKKIKIVYLMGICTSDVPINEIQTYEPMPASSTQTSKDRQTQSAIIIQQWYKRKHIKKSEIIQNEQPYETDSKSQNIKESPIQQDEIFVFLPKSKSLLQINQKQSNVNIQMVNGSTYEGEWMNGVPHGQGKYTLENGNYFVGNVYYFKIQFIKWENGKLNGQGKFVSQNGETYEGQWVNNAMCGFGIYEYKNGCKYEGFWENNKPHGKGREFYSDQSIYEGKFVEGVKQEFGKFIFPDGSIYEGEFMDDQIKGYGKYVRKRELLKCSITAIQQEFMKENLTMVSSMVMEHFNGLMVKNSIKQLFFLQGRSYKGQYQMDKKEGQGIFTWPDGRQYIGNWKDGFQDGEGEFINKNNEIKKGIWKKGKLINWI